jgi:arylsulfatase A-like enzyme
MSTRSGLALLTLRFLVVGPALLLASCAEPVSSGPDVIFITVDTLRRDHVSAFDADSPVETRAIDALAADSILYTQAWSPISVTGPAFCTVMTGRDPGDHGVVMNLFRGGMPLPENVPTLAQALRHAGYATAAFVSGFTLRRPLLLDRGFDVYEAPHAKAAHRPGDETVAMALEWLEDHRRAVFLWIHLFDPHGPLNRWDEVPSDDPKWRRGGSDLRSIAPYQRIEGISDPLFYAQRYARGVAFADDQVGRVIRALRSGGRYDEALIVFLADHGESFDERELWFDHGTTAYAEQLHVPLLVKLPDGRGAGSSDDRLAGLADVAPTVLSVLGLESLDGSQGRSLLDEGLRTILVGENSHCKNAEVLSCRPRGAEGKSFAARDERWTLVYEPSAEGPRHALFDRTTDPRERQPLPAGAAEEPLTIALDSVRQARLGMSTAPTDDEVTVTPEALEALRSLGYVD